MPNLTLDAMRRLLRKGLGNLSEDDLSDAECDELLNLALWKIWQKFEFRERECRIYAETTQAVSDYGLPEDTLLDSIISVAIKDGAEEDEGQWTKLEQISKSVYDTRHSTKEEAQGKPEVYHRLKHTLILDPVPDDGPDGTGYTIRIVFWRTAATLLEGTLEGTGLPPNWDEIVLKGAIARGHFFNEDYTQAAAATSFEREDIKDAVLIKDREIQDGRYHGLQVLWDKPE